MEKFERGREIEDAVERLCKIMFLADFTVRSPQYKKESGLTKEAADFLVPFDQHLLAFQVKTKTEIKPASAMNEVDVNRIESRINHAIEQLNTVQRALKSNLLTELNTLRGLALPFRGDQSVKLIGVVIFHLFGTDNLPDEEKVSLYNGFEYRHDIPVHIFKLENFENIATEIDTLPDFIDYLNVREFLYSKRILIPLANELDLLTIYKTQKDTINDCLNGKLNFLYLEEGIWEQYKKASKKTIEQRNKLNAPSYLIDRMIEFFHTSIGFDPVYKNPAGRNDLKLGTIENYWASIVELSRLTRLERRGLGLRMIEKMVKANQTGEGYGYMQTGGKDGILVLSTKSSRQERVDRLFNLSSIAYCGLGLNKIMGIATEPMNYSGRSFDMIVLKDVRYQNQDELAALMEKAFGTPRNYSFSEYTDGKEKLSFKDQETKKD